MEKRKWLWPSAIGAAALIVIIVAVMALRGGGEAMAAADAEDKLKQMYGGEVREIVQDGDVYRVTLERIDGVFEAVVDSDDGAIISLEKTKSVDPIPEADMKEKITEQYGSEPSSIVFKDHVYNATIEDETSLTEAEYDAVTGEQIKEKVTEKESSETPPDKEEPLKPSVRLTSKEAASIVLKEFPGELDDVEFEESSDGGYYLVQVETPDDREVEVQIHAISGDILTWIWDD
ncbi:PepSY domain-containing protein [Bhargavaea beijingensis]|uniref:Peptidase propeptide and YPEB domain-containing protein n=1 Tax=Bhargavaea beijingensis TaxID=426756 RepID=A0A1G6Z2A0_9BACL|nr:PepSY domain-containing protein [Bhargavaea beijingensis]MCW1929591.1 PepSY domain-containing protein [Bhargavaea beijingensis]SDD96067.1 Peptidase propeptide and YPEB domain-containing protein [Bhargavaea beijingensis]